MGAESIRGECGRGRIGAEACMAQWIVELDETRDAIESEPAPREQ